jgi:hypothetical protein
MRTKNYSCPNCSITTTFPGLCRICTTYDDDGSVIEAVRRTQCDEFGNQILKISREPTVSRDRAGNEIRRGFRPPPKEPNAHERPRIAESLDEVPEIVEVIAEGIDPEDPKSTD